MAIIQLIIFVVKFFFMGKPKTKTITMYIQNKDNLDTSKLYFDEIKKYNEDKKWTLTGINRVDLADKNFMIVVNLKEKY